MGVVALVRDMKRSMDRFERQLSERARSLQTQAAALGYGGIGVHLEAALRSWEAGDQVSLSSRLEILEQLVEQATEELAREQPAGEAHASAGPESIALEPPPLLNLNALPSQRPPALPSLAGAAPLGQPPVSASSPDSRPFEGFGLGGSSGHAGARAEAQSAEFAAPSVVPESIPLPPPLASAPPTPAHQRPAAIVQQGRALQSADAEPQQPVAVKSAPAFAVRSMFGLKPARPAGQLAGPPEAPAAAAADEAAPSPALQPAPAPARRAVQQPSAHASPPASLFGLAPRHRNQPLAPPPVVADPHGLPPLSEAEAGRGSVRGAFASADMKQRLERIKQAGADSSAHAGPKTAKPSSPRSRLPSNRRSRGRSQSSSLTAWAIATVAGGGLVILSIVAYVVLRDAPPPAAPLSAPPVASAKTGTGDQPAAVPGLTVPEERFNELLRSVHGHGGQASPELTALLDEQAAIARQALQSGKCESGDDGACAALTELHETLLGDQPLYVERRERSTTRPRWMEGLRLPQIPVDHDARVKQVFEFFTQNPVGRERIQKMLFRCGAYQDLIRSTLERLGLPLDLQAVVFAESGCNPTALSPAGAAGLWQFMPATARAYHLRVEEDVVDERLNPFKSTDAAVRLLMHLHQKLGDWELALASYNLGPFGVLSRVERAGGNVGFWDLVDAGLMPEETANYVPTIQAIALILRNLRSLKFAGTQMRAPQLTADLSAPGGTRLSLIARAAATSLRELKRLNPDIVGDSVPNLGNDFAVQVPKDVVWQARDTLKALRAQNNQDDLCVNPDFDWGRQEFTESMAKACHRKLKTNIP